jgi:hypothetical protein
LSKSGHNFTLLEKNRLTRKVDFFHLLIHPQKIAIEKSTKDKAPKTPSHQRNADMKKNPSEKKSIHLNDVKNTPTIKMLRLWNVDSKSHTNKER